METRPVGRAIEIATALALGLVSVITALGVLQASGWTSQASRLASDSADARDQGIAIAVTVQLRQRADFGAMLEARHLTQLRDAALAAGDFEGALELESEIGTALGTVVSLPENAFEEWASAGFPEDANPTRSPGYLVATQGRADAVLLTSTRLDGLSRELTTRAGIFGQASLVHALALFLFGIAGINRLRAARYVTLGLGALVFAFGLFLMSTAY